jgi:hypothetical protein
MRLLNLHPKLRIIRFKVKVLPSLLGSKKEPGKQGFRIWWTRSVLTVAKKWENAKGFPALGTYTTSTSTV